MPLYDYECASCSHTVEIRHSMHGDLDLLCKSCGEQLHKLISTPRVGPSSFQCQAVLTTGEKIDGSFGKTAPKKRNKWG